MGFFFGTGKSFEKRGNKVIDQVQSGKGFYGRTMRAFVGAEHMSQIQGAIDSAQTTRRAHEMIAAGARPTTVTVLDIRDTGRLVNHDPIVDLVVRFDDGRRLELQPIVSKLAIPRVGERVDLLDDPQRPGGFVYVGITPPDTARG